MKNLAQSHPHFTTGALALAAVLLAAAGSLSLQHRLANAARLDAPDSAEGRLHSLLPGAKLSIPATAGLWRMRHAAGQILVQQADAAGLPVTLDLCEQRTHPAAAVSAIYPVEVAAGWPAVQKIAAASEGRLLRSPIVLPAGLAAGFPRVSIRGEVAGDDESAASASLRVDIAGAGDWVVLGGKTGTTAEAAPASSRLIDTGAVVWLLWGRDDAATSPGAAEAQRYRHGLRLTREAGASTCGRLEFAQFSAVDGKHGVARPRVDVFASDGQRIPLRLPVGPHPVPMQAPGVQEDRELFQAAVAQGLIRVGADQRIDTAPPDLVRARRAGLAVPEWAGINADSPSVAMLMDRLYRHADGRHVRQAVDQHNQQRAWVAWRIAGSATRPGGPTSGSARAGGQQLAVAKGMPDVAIRLFAAPPAPDSGWLRVAEWPATGIPESVVLTLPLDARPADAPDLTLLGRVRRVSGAAILERLPACGGTDCATPEQLTRLRLAPAADATAIEIEIAPDRQFRAHGPGRGGFNPVRVRDGKPVWVEAPAAAAAGWKPAPVRLRTADGLELASDGEPRELTERLGLVPVVGLPGGASGLIENLSRLGAVGETAVDARLTLDAGLQQLAHRVLDCISIRDGIWDAIGESCTPAASTPPPERTAALVLLDARTGAIAALAAGPANFAAASTADWESWDRFNPVRSPLRVHALHHAGGLDNEAGSTFKLVDALALEQVARRRPALNRLLDGLPLPAVNAAGAARGFKMNSPCYPGCSGTPVSNFDLHTAEHSARNGRFGLVEALAGSVNTWFAWLADDVDATVDRGVSRWGLPRAIGVSLGAARPIAEMADRLGFEQPLPLDGGLLSARFPWRAQDVLAVTPSTFDPIQDFKQLRLQAIGARSHVTPVQMARVAAAIATGQVPRPYLLAELNQRAAEPGPARPLDVPLTRTRAGMRAVVELGTARSAFTALPPALRAGLYGKTGTAERADLERINTSWFVGYAETGILAPSGAPMAFAVKVGHTEKKGGEIAAPVIAALAATLQHRAAVASR